MRRSVALYAFISGVILLASVIPACAASIENLTVTPSAATANSTYTFSFVWQDDDGRAPNSLEIQLGDNDPLVLYYADAEGNPLPGLLDADGNPLVISDGKPANEGTTYKIRATAGLHFVLVEPDPEALRPVHPMDPSLIYLPYLTAEGNGAPKTLRFEARGTLIIPPEEEGGEVEIENIASEDEDEPSFSIYNSYYVFTAPDDGSPDIYAGKLSDSSPYWGVDTASGYANYPDPLGQDPLTTIAVGGVSPDDPFNPDDGASSTGFVFRVLYTNAGNLPPRQWLPGDFFGGVIPDRRGAFWSLSPPAADDAGVVLFIRRADVEGSDFVAVPMQKEDSEDNTYTDGVIYRVCFPLPGG